MANRFPLIANSSSNQIQELANADNLDLTGNNIVGLKNIIATGVATAAQFSGNITGVAATFSGNVSVGGVLTYEDVTNIDSVGVVTARVGIKVLAGGINAVGVVTATSFVGSAAGLTSIPAGQLTGTVADARLTTVSSSKLSGALPAIDGSALTGVISGVQVKENTTSRGTSITSLDFVGATVTASGAGSTITIASAGLTTEALVSSGIVTTLNLTAAQDHKVTASGITTITVSGGTEADSHTVRIINSGITTVGFSTFFLFPSGSTPSLPTASGAISLISFTVNRVGAGGTQLLAGASVNFS
jgi:hypothetical protein